MPVKMEASKTGAMRLRRMNRVPESVCDEVAYRVKCDQSLLHCDDPDCSHGSKHIEVRSVPPPEQEMTPLGIKAGLGRVIRCQCGVKAGALVANCSSCGLAGSALWILA